LRHGAHNDVRRSRLHPAYGSRPCSRTETLGMFRN
jgi:hypothetical protein